MLLHFQPEVVPGAVIIMPHTPGGNSYLILSYNQSQAINKNKLLDKSQKIIYTWQVAGDGG